MGNQKLKWTNEEEMALLAGVEKHGPGKWKIVLRDPEFADKLSNRSNVDLKDKWRNLSVPLDIQGSKDKERTPKIKAAALNLAAVAAAATSTPTTSVTRFPVAPLPRSGSSDLNVDDSLNTTVDAKNVPRYDGMIFEALSELADVNGSDVNTIVNFIEKRQEMPPQFKRVLGTRLRRLAAQGKLEKVNQLKPGMQNFYKMNDKSFVGMRTPVVARPKEVNVKPRQTNSQVPTVSQEKVNHASGTAAFKLAEVERKLELVKRAAEERDRMIELAEKADIILLLAEELHQACSEGKIVELN